MFNGTPTQNFPVKTVPSKNNYSNLYIISYITFSTISLFPAIIPNISTSFTYQIKNKICDSRAAMSPAFCRARVYGLPSCVNSKGRFFADECLLLVYKKANAN